MSKKIKAVQELKAERVQEEIALVAEEPFRISLKAERVQEPAFATVTIELPALQTVITLHGTTTGTAQAPGLGEAR
jgi:hypothetical protein